jgi:hypothetical protein
MFRNKKGLNILIYLQKESHNLINTVDKGYN